MDNKVDINYDKDLIYNYEKMLSFHLRKFHNISCKTCFSKTEEQFHYIYNDIWILIHCLPFKLKTNVFKNNELKNAVNSFYNKIKYLPCNICKKHYNAFLRNFPIRNLTNNIELQNWTIDLHNEVNSRLNKPSFSYDRCKYMYRNMNVKI